MRTKEQINNLRNVVGMMSGGFAFLFSDEQIDNFGDRLQNQINSVNFIYVWEIRVRTKDNCEKEWSQIEKEPTSPCCTLEDISSNCARLLEKYPAIVSIQVSNPGSKNEKSYIFVKGNESHKIS